MNISKWIMLLLVFVWPSCSSTKCPNKSDASPSDPCCEQGFRICFSSESSGYGIDCLEIHEHKRIPVLYLGTRMVVLRSKAEFESLKRAILASSLWKENAKADYPMFFTGDRRDILLISNSGFGMTLQGSQIPPRWKQRMLNLVRSAGQKGAS